jgi:hypothetical protein
MHRILSVAAGVVLVSATVHVSAQQPPASRTAPTTSRAAAGRAMPAAPTPSLVPRMLPGTRPNVLTTIQGNTLTSTNGALPYAVVRLRDARIGRIVDTQVSDKTGLFGFRAVDPGSYIVEIIGDDQTVLAASQMLNVNAGEVISAVVKLPLRIQRFAGLLGNTTPSAIAVTAAAGTAQVLAMRATTSTSIEN